MYHILAERAFACRELLGWAGEEAFELLGEVDGGTAGRLAATDLEFATYQRELACRALRYEIADPSMAETPELTLGLLADRLACGYDPVADGAPLAHRRMTVAGRPGRPNGRTAARVPRGLSAGRCRQRQRDRSALRPARHRRRRRGGGAWAGCPSDLTGLAGTAWMWADLDEMLREDRPLVRGDTPEGTAAFYPSAVGNLCHLFDDAANRRRLGTAWSTRRRPCSWRSSPLGLILGQRCEQSRMVVLDRADPRWYGR